MATATTAALATTLIVSNALIAFGVGAGAPVIVKKLAQYAESLLPGEDNVSTKGK
ncbi:hypothetical protein [Nocardia sp.]|uniref:hypothetical protein n=1 Tax=Nocardia sp. TaxID=1821 RepID=UPI002609073E|nr:hypothetical protein [Nocardia sp.]